MKRLLHYLDSRIEELRLELNHRTEHCLLTDREIISLSQELDMLLNQHRVIEQKVNSL